MVKKRKFTKGVSSENGYVAICNRTGMDIGHLSRILNGRRDPRLSTLRKLAKGMKMGLDELVALIEKRRARGVPPELSRRISEGVLAANERRSSI